MVNIPCLNTQLPGYKSFRGDQALDAIGNKQSSRPITFFIVTSSCLGISPSAWNLPSNLKLPVVIRVMDHGPYMCIL